MKTKAFATTADHNGILLGLGAILAGVVTWFGMKLYRTLRSKPLPLPALGD